MKPFMKIIFIALLLAASVVGCQSKKMGVISVDEVFVIINDPAKVNEYVLLDTRTRMDYFRGHLITAVWVNPDSLKQRMTTIVQESRPFIIYDSGSLVDSAQIIKMLHGMGVTNFRVMEGGFSKWTKRGYPAAIQLVRNTGDRINVQPKEINPDEAYAFLNATDTNFALIDIRSYPAFAEAHIKGALSIPYVPINEFVVKVEEQNFPRSKPLIIYGDSDSTLAEKATDVMLRNDFSNVYLLKGGIGEWARKKFPIDHPTPAGDFN